MTAISNGAFPIATAPRDGRVISVINDEVGSFLMAWNPAATNELFAPGRVGMWEAPDRSMTWVEGEDGPTHWRPFIQETRPALCTTCSLRLDDATIRACSLSDCPNAQREAA